MTTIKVLILEDLETDFIKLEKIVKQISEDDLGCKNIQLELLYNCDDTNSIIANFVASKTMEAHLQKTFKDSVLNKVEQIKKESMLICLLDIVWTKDAKKKQTGKANADEYGCDFYCDFLNNTNINENTIMVTAISRIPNRMSNIERIDKIINKRPFGDDFKTQFKRKLFNLPIIKNNIPINKIEDNINSHTKK
jgi:hypothetical protein